MADIYLIIVNDRMWLAEEDSVIRRDRTASPAPAVVFNISHAARGFSRLHPDAARRFGTPEIAAIAAHGRGMVCKWLAQGTITAAKGLNGRGRPVKFTHREAFAVGCIGSLARVGVGENLLRRAFRLLVTAGADTEKPRQRIPEAREELPTHDAQTGRVLVPNQKCGMSAVARPEPGQTSPLRSPAVPPRPLRSPHLRI